MWRKETKVKPFPAERLCNASKNFCDRRDATDRAELYIIHRNCSLWIRRTLNPQPRF